MVKLRMAEEKSVYWKAGPDGQVKILDLDPVVEKEFFRSSFQEDRKPSNLPASAKDSDFRHAKTLSINIEK
jgi:hypothetical protein